MRVYDDIDIRKNRLQNIRLDPVNAFPSSPVNGQVVFREDVGVFYWYKAAGPAEWRPFGNTTVVALAGSGLTSAPQVDGSYQISFNPNIAFLDVDMGTNTVIIKAQAVTENEIKDGNVTTIKIQDGGVTFAKIQNIPTMTVIGRTAAGTGVTAAIPILNENDLNSNSPTSLATQSSIKAYVDSKLGAFGQYEGSYNASTAGGAFPQRSLGNLKGSMWDISVGGILQGEMVQAGDVVMARIDNASPLSRPDWIIFQSNLQPSTELVAGYMAIATQAETNLGVDDTKAVTPKKLLNFILSQGGRYTTDLGDGITTTFPVVHNLGTTVPTVELFNNTTFQWGMTTWAVIDMNSISVTFTTAPTVAQFTIVIKPA